MGGIHTDLRGRIANVKDLFAVGECANTGYTEPIDSPATRFWKDSFLTRRVAQEIAQSDFSSRKEHYFSEAEACLSQAGDKELKNELRRLMWRYAGILRDEEGLAKAQERVEAMLALPIGKF